MTPTDERHDGPIWCRLSAMYPGSTAEGTQSKESKEAEERRIFEQFTLVGPPRKLRKARGPVSCRVVYKDGSESLFPSLAKAAEEVGRDRDCVRKEHARNGYIKAR